MVSPPINPHSKAGCVAVLSLRRRLRVRAASCHMAIPESGRRGWNRRRCGPNRANSVRIGLYRPKRLSQAEIQKKKKKGAKRTVWLNLNTQTPSDPHFVQNSQTPFLTPSFISLLCVLRPSSLFSVFWALCECCVHTALLQTLVSNFQSCGLYLIYEHHVLVIIYYCS